MWRFWNCFPRFVRQQLHGPRASAGVYVEEEKAEHDVDTYVSDTVREGPDHKRRDSQTLCLQPKCEEEPKSGHQGGAHHDNNDWWNTHCHGNFWCHLFGQHRALEAVTWGAAVVLGLQLSRQQHHYSWTEVLRDRDKRQRWRGLLFRVAFATPTPPDLHRSVGRSIIPRPPSVSVRADVEPEPVTSKKDEGQAQPQESASVTDDKKSLDDVMRDFESSCRQYAAVGSSVSGVCAMDQGQLTTAVKHLRLACELGHSAACFNLALCYQQGLGVDRDTKQAASHYEMAAEEGHAQSIFNLALMTLKGEGGLTQDSTKAMQLLKQAADQGLAQAQTYLGVYYTEDEDDQQDFEQAAAFFKAAACQNDAEAQYFLGICYENGWGVESSDEEAARLYAAATDLGHDGAMYNMAAFHEYGLGGVERDEEEAMTLYRRSAQRGNESAKFRLQEVEARRAVSEWSEENQTSPKTDPVVVGLRRSPHSSSPTFSDFMRECIANAWKGELTSSSSTQTLATPPPASSGQRLVTFMLGGQDVSQDQAVGYSLLDTAQAGSVGVSCVSGMHRTATMPELRLVSCQ